MLRRRKKLSIEIRAGVQSIRCYASRLEGAGSGVFYLCGHKEDSFPDSQIMDALKPLEANWSVGDVYQELGNGVAMPSSILFTVYFRLVYSQA